MIMMTNKDIFAHKFMQGCLILIRVNSTDKCCWSTIFTLEN